MAEKVLLRKEHGVAWITMNRPEALNAWDPEMIESLVDRLSEVATDQTVRVVIITGTGKAFSAGGDIKVQKQNLNQPFAARLARATMAQNITRNIVNMEKPVIAAVNGVAIGSACDMVWASDIRISSENASFCEAFIKRGLIPDLGSMYFLPRLVGVAKAKEIVFNGDMIDAKEALRMGLVNTVVAAEDLESEVLNVATRLAKGPTLAIGQAKKVINKSLATDLETHLDYALQGLAVCYYSEDHAEATIAFEEKREPRFEGR